MLEWRIIPARAGFTGTMPTSTRGEADHPRSRGVYLDTVGPYLDRVGSSPLARGLPAADTAVKLVATDHPRSRGVYLVPPSFSGAACGSSPLARGLRVAARDPQGHVRIIPARAGFTRTRTTRGHASWDHPRSRGVYDARSRGYLQSRGSSPLARGLRGRRATASTPPRIIPARAGFTASHFLDAIGP